ncbi:MAG: S-layer homology domain-containing protein, partial [Candidatus Margulisiibacteriota bacterium]
MSKISQTGRRGLSVFIFGAFLGALFFNFWQVDWAAAETKVANDPTRLGVSARILGMGKAAVGLDDDPGIMFINPSGIGSADQWQMTSMTGNFINEVNYSQLAGVYPTEFGNFGIGYIGSGLGFTSPTSATAEVSGDVRVIPSSTEGDSTYNYNNSAMLVTYGLALSRFFDQAFLKDTLVGANFKLFSQNLAGTGVTGGTATGCNLDLGMIYKQSDIFSVGLNLQNILPASLGGALVWPTTTTRTSAVEETLPSNLKLGMAYKIMGRQSPLKSDQEVLWLLDVDRSLTLSNYPMLFHTGVEWHPVKMAALRFGFDQDVVGGDSSASSANSNLTAGVGVEWDDFRFDYAYHQYDSVSENDTHYFSLSYGVAEKAEVVFPKAFEIIGPRDRAVVLDEKVRIKGKVLDPKMFAVEIQDKVIKLTSSTDFSVEVPVLVGKNYFAITALDKQGQSLYSQTLRLVRLLTFKDVPADSFAKFPIECLATMGIITGYPDGTFKPSGTITRAELCTLLVKTKGLELPAVTQEVFSDVPQTHWAAASIKAAV